MPAPRRLALPALATLVALGCALLATSAQAAPTPFAPRQQVVALGNGGAHGQLAKANLNGDQYDDFVLAYSTPGAATGSLGSFFFKSFVGSANGYSATYNLTAGADVTQPRLVAAADLDGDGRDEALHTRVSFGSTSVTVEAFHANGSRDSARGGGASYPGFAASLITGDFVAGDAGAEEFAVRSTSGDVRVYDFNGTSYFLAASFAAQPGTIGALDYDTTATPADGIDDIVVGSATGTSDPQVYQSNGTGTFTLAGTLPRNSDAPSAGFARASFDGSGGNDFAVAGATPVVSAYAAEGGTYARGETGVAGSSTAFTRPAVGDFDADGLDDYAIFTSVLTTFTRPAGATSFLPTQTSTIATGGYDVLSAISLDFRNDGRDDLLVYGSDGNISVYRSDATPPQTTITARPPALTSSTSAGFSFSADESATFECRLDATDGGDWSACTTPQPYSGLAAGSHTFDVRATDAAGNLETAPESATWTIDPTPPAAPVATLPANGAATNDATPAYAGSAESGSTVTVIVDGTSIGTATADGSGDWTLTQPTNLADGPHTVRATATDAAGNTGPTSSTNSFTVDATAPAAPALSAPADGSSTNDDTPPYSGSAEANSTVMVIVDGVSIGTTTADGAGNWSLTQPTALSQAVHTVRATATDAAGNTSGASSTRTFVVDTTAPGAPTLTAPLSNATTADRTPAYAGTAEGGSTVTVVVDGAPTGTTTADGGGDWTLAQPTDLGEGPHSVRATATDAAGNTGPSSGTNSFTVDATAPAAPALGAPADGSGTNDATPPYSGSAEGSSTVTVIVDGVSIGTTAADGSGNWSLTQPTALSQAVHTVRATATDAAGNTSADSSTRTFVVDITAPGAPTLTAPLSNATTADPTPTVAGHAEADATIAVSLDGSLSGTTTADGAGSWSYTPSVSLSDGAHTTTATASDAVGNTSGASSTRTFTVDTTVPAAPVVDTPVDGSTTADATPLVSGHADDDAMLAVHVDGAVVAATSTTAGGDFSYTPMTPLAEGPHTVYVSASDISGNGPSDSNATTFTVDTVAPEAPAVSTEPADVSASTAFAFSGDADTVSFECRVDAAPAWVACASPFEPALADGARTVEIRAVDDAGNRSAAYTRSWTLDTTEPTTPTLTSGPDASSTSTSATFVFSDEPGATFECRIDGGPWTACTSGKTYAGLAVGGHVFAVRATDAAGNVGATHTVRFTVAAPAKAATPKPTPTSPTSPAPTRDAMSFSLAVAPTGALERGAIPVGCVLDAGQLSRCTVRAYAGTTRVGTGVKNADGQSTTVRVKLTQRGLRRVRRVGGARLVLRGKATTVTGKAFRARAQSRVLPLTATAVPTDGLFASGERMLTKSGRAYVRRLAAALAGAKRVTCIGHTNSLGSRARNAALGLRRAKTVCATLRKLGVDARLVARSAGESRPRAGNETVKGRALNRRVELAVRYR